MAYSATVTLDRGRRAGLLTTAGIAAGLSVHAIVAALGLGVLVGQAPVIYGLLRWTGVAYLLYLAWETWQLNGKAQSDLATAASNSLFLRGFFSNVFNPKTIMFFVSVVPEPFRRQKVVSCNPRLICVKMINFTCSNLA